MSKRSHRYNPQMLIENIPLHLLSSYMERRITSEQLAEATGYHAASLRRAIKRPPRAPQPKNKTVLIDARKAFRATLSHLPAAEIQKLANVSLSTANRIRKAGKDGYDDDTPDGDDNA